ncbi:MAG: alpha/beta hydrolase [Deltaproteobacteria bacterium]|nr:MAG: alpha/beta hydrolase [Deltaproteobacteria bacterium]
MLPPALQRRLLLTVLGLPRPVRRRLFGAPPVGDRGQRMDEDLAVLVALERRLPQGMGKGSVEEARAAMRRAVRTIQGDPRPAVRVERREVAGRPCRLYRAPGPPRALLVYLHGGGWVCGDLDTHDRVCRRFAEEARRAVLAVDYRLAPEHPFPAGFDDVVAVLRQVLDRDLPGVAPGLPVEVGGDSAGGNLAAAACLALREDGGSERGRQPARQLLVYPAVDLRMLTVSHRSLGHGYLLEASDLEWYRDHYGCPDLFDWRASPLLAESHAGLPPAIVVTAGFDPLRDEGQQYADRLERAGVSVCRLHEPGLTHGFLNMDGVIPAADRAFARVCRALLEGC